TVSLAAAKPGRVRPHGAPWVGSLHVGDIAMPAPVRGPVRHYLLDGRALGALPEAMPESHKNSFGHVTIIGGAPGLSGAGHLAAAAALRAGAGLVSAAAPAGAVAAIKSGWPEIMTLALGEDGATAWPREVPESLRSLLSRSTALAIGPGMGRGEDAAAFLAAVLELKERPPAVIDADALILLARQRALFSRLTAHDILTPHPGEAAALLETDSASVQADRSAALAALCDLGPMTVVLKGAGTLVGQASAPVFISPYAVPALAMGGSGDVLAGCTAALLGRGGTKSGAALRAAGSAVALHALAGRSLERDFPGRGCLASELADRLPHVRASLAEQPQTGWERRLPWTA
ncbi:MAG: NAD(P)H-hydrate dehydratase, partial [Desulfovibrio sp.]|nr:NAD(P)H-hydrate dehydratase [Desulfovibrio sp.]